MIYVVAWCYLAWFACFMAVALHHAELIDLPRVYRWICYPVMVLGFAALWVFVIVFLADNWHNVTGIPVPGGDG